MPNDAPWTIDVYIVACVWSTYTYAEKIESTEKNVIRILKNTAYFVEKQTAQTEENSTRCVRICMCTYWGICKHWYVSFSILYLMLISSYLYLNNTVIYTT